MTDRSSVQLPQVPPVLILYWPGLASEAASLRPRTQGCQQCVWVTSFIRPHRIQGGWRIQRPPSAGRGSPIAPQSLKLSRHHDTSLAMVAASWTASDVQDTHIFLRSWMEEGQLTRQGRQTNKQTEGIKIEKNRADETWRCVFIAASELLLALQRFSVAVRFKFPHQLGIVLQHGFNAAEQRDTAVLDAFTVQGLLQKQKQSLSHTAVYKECIQICALSVFIQNKHIIFNTAFQLP
ncbi:hypothetical protein ABVT39_019946 [Epinephelus coioides]